MRGTAEAARFAGDLLARVGRDAAPEAPIRDRILRGAPAAAAVLAPDSADAVAEVLALCSAEAWPARIVGAVSLPFRDARPVVVISCHRLDAVTEHEPADLVVGAGAGISLDGLARTLAHHRQWLPLDPPAAPLNAQVGPPTLGGAIAAAAAGPLRAGHGTPRDMVLGLEVVTGDGRRLRFGGRVVKNVAGYDTVRLLVGSGGRLGALTHAFTRLRALPERDETLIIACGRGPQAAAAACARALRIRDDVEPAALEVVSVYPGTSGPEWNVAIRLQGGEAGVAEAMDAVRRLEPSARIREDGTAWWRRASEAEARGADLERAHLLPGGLGEALRDVAGRLEGAGGGRVVAAHVTDGVIRAWLPPERAADRTALPAGGVEGVMAGTGASARVLTGIIPGRGSDPRAEELTRRLCAVFDPAGILQPGEEADA